MKSITKISAGVQCTPLHVVKIKYLTVGAIIDRPR